MSNWTWQNYTGSDPIKWAGCWTWFDDADFARPYTRTGPNCPGSPATYPDGTIATGFINNDESDPRNSRVYDACAVDDIFGKISVSSWGSNKACDAPDGVHAGLIYVPSKKIWASAPSISKDTACPMWADFAHAITQFACSMTGCNGTWDDSMSAWDSFTCQRGPVTSGFGKWSVARFRTYLRKNFSVSQLISWGVIPPGGSYTDLSTFDIAAFLRNMATTKYGWDGVSIVHDAWKNPGWIDEPVWSAYKIFKRQAGTGALANIYNSMKSGALAGGEADYFVMGNDITPAMLGWQRGYMDMASTELSLGWNLSSGSRGICLPPFGRVAPFYKAAREHGRGRFANVWLYNYGYVDELKLTPVINAIYYEMLATHTTPKLEPSNPIMTGSPAADKAFMQFVADKLSPEIGARSAVEDVGIYLSTSSILWQWTPQNVLNFGDQPHHFAVWGWATALDELHYQYPHPPGVETQPR